MANNLSGQTWFIDTAAATPVFNGAVRIKFIEVVGGSVAPAVGDVLADVQDRLGRSIILSRAQVAAPQELQTFNLENWFDGLRIAALGPNGVTLRIHVT